MQGLLFSQYFLDTGISAADSAFAPVDDAALAAARAVITPILDAFSARSEPNEAQTEADAIEPLLDLLGWTYRDRQSLLGPKAREDVPDYLLYADAAAKAQGNARPREASRHGLAILEGKRWGRPLDSAGREGSSPVAQLRRYLATAEATSGGRLIWGILTNGQCWRLYRRSPNLDDYLEIDLAVAAGDAAVLRLFLMLFGRAAFVPGAGGRSPLDQAVERSRDYEARVTEALAETVFTSVFPGLANALADADPERGSGEAYLADLREAALTWLYRLLFVLYAEDRDLLPTRARADGLNATRRAVAEALDLNRGLSETRTNYDGDLRDLWRQIDEGDRGIGMPPYNGGLFRADRSGLLERTRMADAAVAPLLDAMSRVGDGIRRRFINYHDLSVQHLGSVYERLLEFDLVEDGGRITTRPQAFARKTSGSYYTPEALVMLVLTRTIGPLLTERRQAFAEAVADPARAKQDPAYRLPWLQQFDPARAFLGLRIVDPAMGSGHFLVSLVDYLAGEVFDAMTEAANLVPFYRSPLLDDLERMRAAITARAKDNGWAIAPGQLDDQRLIRRIILKRVVHGVDKNPMAVELAKLALWLHSFTVGAPLSFLDHHLRCGDSLFGEWLHPAITRLEAGGLFKRDLVTRAERAIAGVASVEDLADADIDEVHASASAFAEARGLIQPLERYLSLLQGYRWIEGSAADALKQAKALQKQADRINDPDESFRLARAAWDLKRKGSALETLLEGKVTVGGKAVDADTVLDIAYGRIGDRAPMRPGDDPALEPLVKAARIAALSNFLHWELAFPTVWSDWLSPSRRGGGFDAVVGNPPWDKLQFDETEWFSGRDEAVAFATGVTRKRLIETLPERDPLLAQQMDDARELTELCIQRVRSDLTYIEIAGNKVNLAGLFAAQAQRLVKTDGFVGLLVPSGIAGDLSSARFFRSLSTTGRLGSLLDFENRGLYFADVHRSFKFCLLQFGGSMRLFPHAECGFFLPSTDPETLKATTFALTPVDFAAVNPNTGTAPVFRTPRDATLTTAIYARLPVLVDRRNPSQARFAWPVRYMQILNVTSDSHLFRTPTQLAADGWYLTTDGWRKGEASALPLYEGKMVQAFDHRAASVTVNPENLHRPGQPAPATPEQQADPAWRPSPQFFIAADAVAGRGLGEWNVAFKDVTAPTNMRTMIAAIVPMAGYGNTLPAILLDQPYDRVLLVANLNAFALDYVARQKVQGQHLNWFIVEQLPVIPPADYGRVFGTMTARDLVAREVLHLTYVSHDMAAFARDMGHVGEDGDVLPPFAWDEADRRQRRARLDALYFHLYGLSREEADYILSTFPIVRRQDEAAFGRFLTRDLILGQMAALAAGDTQAVIA